MACIDINVEDYLDEVDTDTLIEELEDRARRDTKDRQKLASYKSIFETIGMDWRLLVDLVAAGETEDALHLIRRMAPNSVSHGEVIMARRRAGQLDLTH